MKFELQRVHYMPKELSPGILYVSAEFGTAAHLCACGCGSKIRTPIGPTEWTLEDTDSGPSLDPSVGNWQKACKSHYWITRGKVVWSTEWTAEQISAGRAAEMEKRRVHFAALDDQRSGILQRFWRWFRSLLGR